MDDRDVVAALVSGDPRGLEGAYRLYAHRLYTYCWGVLHDADAAADAVHDTFIIASQRAGQLREPDRLRAWLYAIAHNECLRLLRARARHVPLEEVGDVSAPPTDPDRSMHAEQVRELVWAAAGALNPGDLQVFELIARDDLTPADVAAVLGVSADHAHARLSRARMQIERALGALLVARTGAADCAELARLLQGWNGVLTVLLRRRLSRHIQACATCSARQRTQLRPQNLLAAYAALPLLIAPAGLWERTKLTCTDRAYESTRETVARDAGRFDPATGFPRPLTVEPRRGPAIASVAVVALVVALVALGGAALLPRLDGDRPAAQGLPTTPAHPPQAAHTANPDPGLAAPSQAPTAASTPAAESLPPPSRTQVVSTTTPAVLPTISAVGRGVCRDGQRYLVVSARTDGGTMRTAELYWTGRFTSHRPMTIDQTGTRAIGEVGPLRALPIRWWVEVAADSGGTAETSPVIQSDPCP